MEFPDEPVVPDWAGAQNLRTKAQEEHAEAAKGALETGRSQGKSARTLEN
ncbi:hypothetical protein [Brotaphodocola sp.]